MNEHHEHDDTPATAPFQGAGIADLAGRLSALGVADEPEAVDEEFASATAVLDLGIRLLGETEPGVSVSAAARAVSGRTVATLTATPITSSSLLSRDNRARRAFILGGPAAVAALESD